METTYTGRNQIASIVADGPPPLASYSYDLNGNRLTKTLENHTVATYSYDMANRLTQLAHSNGGIAFAQFDYALNSVGNRTAKTLSGSAIAAGAAGTQSYSYDATDQLTQASYPDARTVNYAYDPVGNRQQVNDSVNGSTSYTANARNQYTSITASAPPTYDANGNLTSVGNQTFTYDSDNRLLTATKGANTMSITYDARRRPVSRTINGTTTYFVYDGWNLIEEYTGTTTPPPSAIYLHGAIIDELLSRTDSTGTEYFHHDGLGSTVALTSATGEVVESYAYDVFGKATIYDASGFAIFASSRENCFLYTGREWINEVGIYDYRNRAYSPELGRFLQTDPIRFHAGDVNLYRYVANNPIDLLDPTGTTRQSREEGCHYLCGRAATLVSMYLCMMILDNCPCYTCPDGLTLIFIYTDRTRNIIYLVDPCPFFSPQV